MSYLATGLQIAENVLFRADQMILAQSDYASSAKTSVTRALRDMHLSAPFPFVLKDPKGILTTASDIVGVVLSISGTTWNLSASQPTSLAGKKIYIDGEGVPYRVLAHIAGSPTLTVDAPYTETIASGSFTAYQDEYSLAADVLGLWAMYPRSRHMDSIEIQSEFSEDQRFFVPSYRSHVDRVSIIQSGTNNIVKIRLEGRVLNAQTFEYSYSVKPPMLTFDGVAATDTPMIPLEDRFVVAEIALFYLKQDIGNDSAEEHSALGNSMIVNMKHHYIGAHSSPRRIPARIFNVH